MIKEYIVFVTSLRKGKGISQSKIAEVIGISRTSYIDVEKGKRELNVSELEKLASFFGVSTEQILSGVLPDYEKYRQMVLAFLRLDKKITKTKLAKLLYFADFGWFYFHLESMSGMQYRKIQYGPVAEPYFRIIDEMSDKGEISIEQTKDGAMLISQTRSGEKIKLNKVNVEEGKLIKKIEKKWKGKKTAEIVDFTHKQLPYLYAMENEVVSYGLFTQENPDEIF